MLLSADNLLLGQEKSSSVSSSPVRIARAAAPNARLSLNDLSPAVLDKLWDAQNAALLPAYEAGKLGLVIFQFHLSFGPSEENLMHVQWCRQRLDQKYSMGVEFRNRSCGKDARMLSYLRQAGIVLVAADELLHETLQRDRAQTGLPVGATRQMMPLLLQVTAPELGMYVRVHRRAGKQRLLAAAEQQAWAQRLHALSTRGSPRQTGKQIHWH